MPPPSRYGIPQRSHTLSGLEGTIYSEAASRTSHASTTISKPEDPDVFKQDLQNIRAIVTCTICDQLLYEPWTLVCGHTYCYNCLCSWMPPTKRKKTCPDCRAPVKQIPTPAFLVKQMVDIFVNRAEIMPPDESTEQHRKKKKEDTAIVEKDRVSPSGLFRGCFSGRNFTAIHRDEADGVLRCRGCGHEYVGGPTCLNCQRDFEGDEDDFDVPDDDLSETDFSESIIDLDSDGGPLYDEFGSVDGGDDAEEMHEHERHYHGRNPYLFTEAHQLPRDHDQLRGQERLYNHAHSAWIRASQLENRVIGLSSENSGEEEDEDEDEDDEEDAGSLQDFIDEDDSGLQQTREDTDDLESVVGVSSYGNEVEGLGDDGDGDDDDSDEGGVLSNRRRRYHPYMTTPSVTSEDHTDVGDELDSASQASNYDQVQVERTLQAGWSPLNHNSDDDSESHGEGEDDDDEDSDTNTMIGNHLSEEEEEEYDDDDDDDDDDDHSVEHDRSVTPQYHPSANLAYNSNGQNSHEYRTNPYMYGSYDRNYNYSRTNNNFYRNAEQEMGQEMREGSHYDDDGDTVMTTSPTASRRGSSVESDNDSELSGAGIKSEVASIKSDAVEYLGSSREIKVEEEDSDGSPVAPVRRRRRVNAIHFPFSPEHDYISVVTQAQSNPANISDQLNPSEARGLYYNYNSPRTLRSRPGAVTYYSPGRPGMAAYSRPSSAPRYYDSRGGVNRVQRQYSSRYNM